MAQKRQKSTAAKITPGLAVGDAQNSEDAVDQANNTWVVAVGPGGGPIVVTTSTAGLADTVIATHVNYFTQQLNLMNDIKKLLWLMAEDQGVVIPDDITQPFNDDVAA